MKDVIYLVGITLVISMILPHRPDIFSTYSCTYTVQVFSSFFKSGHNKPTQLGGLFSKKEGGGGEISSIISMTKGKGGVSFLKNRTYHLL